MTKLVTLAIVVLSLLSAAPASAAVPPYWADDDCPYESMICVDLAPGTR